MAMSKFSVSSDPRAGKAVEGTNPLRIVLQIALQTAATGSRSFTDIARQAADASGGDLLFVLPCLDGDGKSLERAAIRLRDKEKSVFFSVERASDDFVIRMDDEIEESFRGFATASVAVLEQLRDDGEILDRAWTRALPLRGSGWRGRRR